MVELMKSMETIVNDGPERSTSTALAEAIKIGRAKLLPFLILMYILAFIDRSNIGFAKAVYQADIGISDVSFASGASLFFIGYAFFEVPMSVLYRTRGRAC